MTTSIRLGDFTALTSQRPQRAARMEALLETAGWRPAKAATAASRIARSGPTASRVEVRVG